MGGWRVNRRQIKQNSTTLRSTINPFYCILITNCVFLGSIAGEGKGQRRGCWVALGDDVEDNADVAEICTRPTKSGPVGTNPNSYFHYSNICQPNDRSSSLDSNKYLTVFCIERVKGGFLGLSLFDNLCGKIQLGSH